MIWMKTDMLVFLQVLIKKEKNMLIMIMNQPERRHRARFYLQILPHTALGRKSEFTLFQSLLQIANRKMFEKMKNHQIMLVPFMISEKEVFAMGSINIFPVFIGHFSRRCGRMLIVIERNVEFIQNFVNFRISFIF